MQTVKAPEGKRGLEVVGTVCESGNLVCGSGHHSHEVPSLENRVVLMRDGTHRGTEVYKETGGKFRFINLESNSVLTAPRCVLVQLVDVTVDEVDWEEPYAMDLDPEDGLAFIGCAQGDEVPGKILWDSAAQ